MSSIARRLREGDLEGAFIAADRAAGEGPDGEKRLRELTFPFGNRVAPDDSKLWTTVCRALDRYEGPAERALWARFYGIALRQALGVDSWRENGVRAVCEGARGRRTWMRWLPGTLLLRRGLWARAAAELAPVARILPRAVTPICSLAEAMLGLGRAQEALRILEAAKPATKNERAAWWAWKGQLRLWLGRREEGLVCLERAGDYDLAFCWRGAAELLLGRPAKALAALDSALAKLPQDVEARTWRAEARRVSGDHSGAVADADAALALSPGNVFALANRALARAALEDHDAARADFTSIRAQRTPWRRHLSRLNAVWDVPGRPKPELVRHALEQALASAKGNRRTDYSLLVTIAVSGGAAE